MISIQLFKEACDSEFCACLKKSKTLKEILERLLSQLCAVEKGTVNFSNWLYSSLKRMVHNQNVPKKSRGRNSGCHFTRYEVHKISRRNGKSF